MNGYIYLRSNKYWDLEGNYKLGKTSNIIDRDSIYITNEKSRGKYILVLELINKHMDDIEKKLQNHFIYLNDIDDGSTGFYKKEIIDNILPFLDENNIIYKKITEEEITQKFTEKFKKIKKEIII